MQKLFTINLNKTWYPGRSVICLHYPSEGLKQAERVGKSKEISKLKVRFREKAGLKMFFKC